MQTGAYPVGYLRYQRSLSSWTNILIYTNNINLHEREAKIPIIIINTMCDLRTLFLLLASGNPRCESIIRHWSYRWPTHGQYFISDICSIAFISYIYCIAEIDKSFARIRTSVSHLFYLIYSGDETQVWNPDSRSDRPVTVFPVYYMFFLVIFYFYLSLMGRWKVLISMAILFP